MEENEYIVPARMWVVHGNHCDCQVCIERMHWMLQREILLRLVNLEKIFKK